MIQINKPPFLYTIFILLILFFFNTKSILTKEVLTWDQCIEELSKNNPELLASISKVSDKEALMKVAYSYLYPKVDGSMSYAETRNSSPYGDAVNVTQQKRYTANLTITQQLFNYSTYGGLEQAKANLQIANIELKKVKAKIEANLKTSFQNILSAQENVQITENFIKLRRDVLNIVKLRYESGRENKGALLIARSNLLQAEYFSLQARNNLIKASRQLAQSLGRTTEEDELYVLGKVPLDYLDSKSPKPNFKTLSLASPEYQASLASLQLAESQVSLAKAGFTPDASATINIGKQDENIQFRSDNWSIGANVKIPIFDGLKNVYGLSSAKAGLETAKSSSKAVLLGTELDLLTKYLDYIEAQTNLNVARSYYESEIVRSKIAKESYINGFLNYTEWDFINNNFVTRTQNYIQAKLNVVLKEALWSQAIGRTTF